MARRVKIEYEGEKMLEINNRIEKKNTKKMRIGGGECHRLKRLKKDSLLDRSFPSCTILHNILAEEANLFRLYLQAENVQAKKPSSILITINYTSGGKRC